MNKEIKNKKRIQAEIEKSKETVTMTPADQKRLGVQSTLTWWVSGTRYYFELNKPTKVHPEHKLEAEAMLGRRPK